MTITLTPRQQAWSDAHIARGDHASPEEAARGLIDAAIADLASTRRWLGRNATR